MHHQTLVYPEEKENRDSAGPVALSWRAMLAIVGLMILMAVTGHAQEAEKRAVVVRPVANMYSAPTQDSDVVSQAIYGVTVVAGEEKAGLLRVKTPDGYAGWMEAAAVRPLEDGESYPGAGKAAMVESLMAHLYPLPTVTKRAPMLTVPFETRLAVIEEREEDGGRWLKVQLADGWTAWVQRGDLTFDSGPRPVPALLELARRFLGLPYTWGGTSSFGFDCSGFTQMLCRRGGVNIPRDAKPQAHWDGMTPVEKDALKPGDLIYFGASMDKISHTGFYIGGGEFIHSTANMKPVLQISRLEEPHWTKLYVCARRWKP